MVLATRHETEHVGLDVMLKACIQEMLNSNFGWDTGYL
jgi:hypothetical protein